MTTAVKQRLSVEAELSNLAAQLLEVFMQSEADSLEETDSQQLLKNYIRHVTRCGLAAGRTGSAQLQDHCVQFQGILKSLLDQPAAVVARYQSVLEQWPLLLMSHLNSAADGEFSRQLDELINTTDWPRNPEVEADAANDSMPSPTPELTAPATNVQQVEASDMQDEAQANHALLLAELDEAMAELVGMYQSGSPLDEPLRQRVLTDTADRLELFAVSAAAAGVFGLMDVAQLFHSSLRELARQAAATLDDEWRDIYMLKTAMMEYLQAPALPESTANLLFALRHMPITDQINDQEISALAALLGENSNPTPDVAAATQDAGPEDASAEEIVAAATPDDAAQTATTSNETLSPQSQELLQLIAAEFEQVTADLAANLQLFSDTASTTEARHQAIGNYVTALERFVAVFDSIGLLGLTQLFNSVIDFLQQHAATQQLEVEQQFWLAEWPAHVMNYLADPHIHATDLLTHCQAENSVLLLDDVGADRLASALQHPQIDSGEEDKPPRQTVAETSDVSLQLPEDVNQQLLDSLLQELPNQTAEFSRVISNVVQGTGNLQDVETAQRVAHTLKGAANTVGVAGIANLTHHIEDILLAFSRQKRLPASPLTNTLQDAADVLEMMSEALLGIGAPPQQQALAVLQQILDWANQIDLNGLPEVSHYTAGDTPVSDTTEKAAAPVSADPSLRVSPQSIDETLRLIGESIIVNAQLEDGLQRTLTQNKAIQAQSALFQQLAFELEQLIDVRGMNTFLSGVSHTAFDALEMDQYNELHTLTRRMVEAATDSRELTQYAEDELKALEGLIHQQKRHNKDTQDVVMKTRMLPVQTIVPRLQRSVRQTCRLTGKEAELVITGAQTLIDNDILTSLADPLMHILRNAVDHGIEMSEQREHKGKPRNGRVTLDFSREGEHILIRCQDDGAGLDYAAIRRVAIENGILSQDTVLSSDELNRLIFVSGLTTREETTQMSGRGIGMDAVHTQISRMKGTIRIESYPQTGLLIEIQLPATLVTLHGIMAVAGDQIVAVSNRGVEQILYADAGIISEDKQNLYYQYKDERYKAYFIEDLLGKARPEQQLDEVKRPAMLLNTGDGNKAAVLVEKILATQDIVIKKLGQYVPTLSGVEGVTILGDGSVAAVIDLTVVLASFQHSDYVPQIERNDLTGIQSGAPKVLVVDDSLSARNSLAEFMQDSGYRVFTARDGIDAIDMLEQHSPDILLVDMEMPRMNGLELTSYVRANKATQNLPIIMVTSRATDKHRREADKVGVNAYLIKPYSETEVLDQVAAQLASAFSNTKSCTN